MFRLALEFISFGDKRDFLLALERVPFLVEFESNPAKFLQREDFDIAKAVKRVCAYWKYRCEIFGNERAFCPMTLTGDGALSPEDVAGYCAAMMFPMKEGPAPALYIDKVLNYAQTPDIRRKSHFYAMQCLSEYDESIKPGFTVVALFHDMMSIDVTSRINAKVTKEGMPVQIAAGHIFCVPNNQSSPLADFIAKCFAVLSTVFNKVLNTTMLIHAHSIPLLRLQTMLSLGISANMVPAPLGGTFTTEDYLTWIIQRQKLERQRYLNFWFDSSLLELFQQDDSVQSIFNQTQEQPPQATLIAQNQCELSLCTAFPQFLTGFSENILESTFDASRHHHQIEDSWLVEDNTRIVKSPLFGNRSAPASAKLMSLVVQAKPLSRAQRCGVQDDAYIRLGIQDFHTAIEETDEFRNTACDAVEETLAVVPFTMKSAYVEACSRCPSLTESESDVMCFLRHDNYDVNSAVGRLVRYWRLRQEIFGERAFLPMCQNGHGALTRKDIVLLKSGVVVLLPNDSEGRSVVMEDRNRIIDDNAVTQHAKLRCLFYVLSLLSDNRKRNEDEFVWLSVLIAPRATHMWNEFAAKSLEIIDCFPIRLKAAHLLVYPPKTWKKAVIDDVVSFTVSLFDSKYGKRTILHSGTKENDMAEKLHPFGINKVCLPATLGGSWVYECWITFLRQQCEYELARDESVGSHANTVKASRTQPLTEAEKKPHRRSLNTIYSRQKRERQNAKVGRLKEQYIELKASNQALTADNARLERVLEQTKNVLERQRRNLE